MAVTQRLPPREVTRRYEIERMFGELVVEDVSREVVGAQHHDDEYSGHGRYFPPWLEHVDGVPTMTGPRTASAWAKRWEDWNLRPYWRPPEAAKVQTALADRAAAITSLESRLLPRLTPAEAEVYRLHYVAGHSINQIARLTRRHRGRITSHLGMVKAKARDIAGGSR